MVVRCFLKWGITVVIWHRKPTTEAANSVLTLHGFCAILRVMYLARAIYHRASLNERQ